MAEATIRLDMSSWEKFLADMKGKLRDTTPILMAGYTTIGFKDIIQHFEDERGPEGAWPARSPVTQAMYAAIESGRRKAPGGARKGSYSPSNKLLQLTGNMRQKVLPAEAEIRRTGNNSIAVVDNASYSGAHEYGVPEKNIPERSFMWLSAEAIDQIGQLLLDKLTEG